MKFTPQGGTIAVTIEVEEHRGDLCAIVNPEGGMIFKLTVPVASASEAQDSSVSNKG